MCDNKTWWLNNFEKEVACLLSRWYSRFEFNPVTEAQATMRFFTNNGSMRDAMWTMAQFRYGYIYTEGQAAALWFDECVLPMLEKERNVGERKVGVK